MNVWKIGAGETGRDYRDMYFKHDVMIIGPSGLGNALEHPYPVSSPSSINNQINRFAAKPLPGDRVIMRLGKEVLAIGQIPEGAHSEYFLDEKFRCVYGWNLCHCRRVLWGEGIDMEPFANAFRNVKGSMPTFTGVKNPEAVVKAIRRIPDSHFSRPLKPMPEIDVRSYNEEQLGVELFQAGISAKNIRDIWEALQQANRLRKWYVSEEAKGRPTEHEIVSHMILPLFLGLGWSHQQMAVEWHKVDMAFFRRMPTTPENCCMILEAKSMGKPLSGVVKQARRYVEKLHLDNVRHIVTTDGVNLFVYERVDGVWGDEPSHYMSISDPQREYVVPEGAKMIETLVRLQPSAL